MLCNSKKKAVGPLVTTILLLVATVTAYAAFHSWYQTYSSDFLTKVTPIVSEDSIKFLDLDGFNLWIRSYAKDDFTYNDITINGVSCGVNGTVFKKSINNLSIGLGSCFSGYTTGVKEVVIYSDSGVFSAKINAHDGGVPSPIIALSSNASVIEFGSSVNLSWTGYYLSACSVSGAWSGNRNTTDSEVQSNLLVSSTFDINCSGPYGSVSDSVSVTVCSFGQSVEEESCVSGIVQPPSVFSLSNSLKFNDDDSAYLSRTPSVDGNLTTVTISFWFKSSVAGTGGMSHMGLFSGYTDNNNRGLVYYTDQQYLTFFSDVGGSRHTNLVSTEVLRDSNVWNHIVVTYDSSVPSPSSDNVYITLNGRKITDFGTETYPSQGDVLQFTKAGANVELGRNGWGGGTNYADSIFSEFHLIDGQALNASYFGEFDDWGNWRPKEFNITSTPKESYGINGFYLPFNNSADLGRDYSSNVSFQPGSARFDGSNDMMSTSSDLTGTSDNREGTFSAWIKYNGGSSRQAILTSKDGSFADITIERIDSAPAGRFEFQIRDTTNTDAVKMNSDTTYLTTGEWIHLLASWNTSSGEAYLYVNDVDDLQSGPTISSTNPIDYTQESWYVGAFYSGSTKANADYAEMYFTNEFINISDVNERRKFIDSDGNPVYLGDDGSLPNGNPPLLYLSGSGNNFKNNKASNVQFSVTGDLDKGSNLIRNDFTVNSIDEVQGLLLHFDNIDGSNVFTDSSGRDHSITPVGTLYHETNLSKFGSSSLYAVDSGYLSVEDSTDFTFGTGDFTIDLWANIDSSCTGANNIGLLSFGTSNTNRATIGVGDCNTSLNFYWHEGSISLNGGTVSSEVWHHVALVRYGTNFSLYLDGELKASTTSGSSFTDYSTLYIGRSIEDANPTPYMYGYIDEVRITKGKALWTSEFTPPTAPATVINVSSEDQLTDSPTDNLATLNSLNGPSGGGTPPTLSEGNLNAAFSANTNPPRFVVSNLAFEVSTAPGYYAEVTLNSFNSLNGFGLGDVTRNSMNSIGFTTGGYIYDSDGNKRVDNSASSYGSSWSTGDVLGVYVKDGSIWFSKNGVWQNSGEPESNTGAAFSGISGEKVIIFEAGGSGISYNIDFNFGQKEFQYTPPTGYKALSVNNIRSTYQNITPSDYFDVKLFTAQGSGSVNITGLSFIPNLMWMKNRDTGGSDAYTHNLIDSVRLNYGGLLQSSRTNAEQSDYSGVFNFDSLGWYTIGYGYGWANYGTDDYVNWLWKEDPVAGFDIVNYTGTATARAIPHNLGSKPELMIIKNRDTANSWMIYHDSVSNINYNGAPANNFLTFTSSALDTNSGNTPVFNRTEPTSTTFTVGTNVATNGNTNDMIAYLFSEVPGFSKIGSYSGNGNANGPFIYTGFKPAYVMIKPATGTTGSWVILDTQRSEYNPVDESLEADNNGAETANRSAVRTDFLSNGFKIRSSDGQVNSGSASYIYVAFAEVPMAGNPSPYVNLSANQTIIEYGSSINLTWDSNYAYNCEASGGWGGVKLASDSEILTQINSTTTYTLTCNGTLTQGSDSVTVTVCSQSEIISNNECIEPFGQSLMFEDDDSPYLSWTPSSVSDSRREMTFSTWFKLGELTQGNGDKNFFTGGSGNNDWIRFSGGVSEGVFEIGFAGTSSGDIKTNMKFSDPSVWHHLHVAFNTSDPISKDRVKVYLDGNRLKDYSIETYPSQNFDMDFITNSQVQTIGARSDPTLHFDGYMSEIHVVDGLDLRPETFGYKDAYGVWQPKYPSSNFNVDTLISGGTGSTIGNMIDAGGLSSAFDGSVNAAASSARVSSATTATIGKDWGSGNTKTIIKFILKAPSDNNFGGSSPATVILQGSNDNTTWYDLYTDDSVTNTGSANIVVGEPNIENQIPYRFHRLVIAKTSASTNNVAEVEFYELGTVIKDYGTNGFYLPFADSSDIGKDYSGNSNSFTANNLVSTDVLYDNPNNNYATMNPIDKGSGVTLSQGNLRMSGSADNGVRATLPVSYPTYWEYKIESGTPFAGGISIETAPVSGANTHGDADNFWYNPSGNKESNVDTSYAASYTSSDIMSVLYNPSTGNLTFWKNGVSQGLAFTVLTNKSVFPAMHMPSGSQAAVINFGQLNSFGGSATTYYSDAGGSFVYEPPSGYKALSVENINEEIGRINASQYFDIATWVGTGSYYNVTSLAFSPDLVWIKNRDDTVTNTIWDILRGPQQRLRPDATNGESTESGGLTDFFEGGFEVNSDQSVNDVSNDMVAWTWNTRSTPYINTNGTVTATVLANPSIGFSIINYTGDGTDGGTIGHGLSSAPEFFVVKRLDTTGSWHVYTQPVGASQWMEWENILAPQSGSPGPWDTTEPNASVITIANSRTNTNTGEYIAYVWDETPGFSKIGSYTGNSNIDGPFIYTGFKPAYIMIKRYSSSEGWVIYDTARDTYNPASVELKVSASPEGGDSNNDIDILSNGFKIRGTNTNINVGDFVYIAFAQKPLR